MAARHLVEETCSATRFWTQLLIPDPHRFAKMHGRAAASCTYMLTEPSLGMLKRWADSCLEAAYLTECGTGVYMSNQGGFGFWKSAKSPFQAGELIVTNLKNKQCSVEYLFGQEDSRFFTYIIGRTISIEPWLQSLSIFLKLLLQLLVQSPEKYPCRSPPGMVCHILNVQWQTSPLKFAAFLDEGEEFNMDALKTMVYDTWQMRLNILPSPAVLAFFDDDQVQQTVTTIAERHLSSLMLW